MRFYMHISEYKNKMMMKRFLLIISIMLPLAAMAQNNWEIPTETTAKAKEQTPVKKSKKKKDDSKYLKGAVPEVDGRVQWELNVDAPGKSAEEIYNLVYGYFKDLTSSENQLTGSQIALVDKAEHSMIVTVKEWIEFKQTIISHDRAATSYVVSVECKDGHMKAILNRIIFDYSENVKNHPGIYKAEEWITDKEALNKKGTRLFPGSARFRRKMCDRKDEVFAGLTNCLKN